MDDHADAFDVGDLDAGASDVRYPVTTDTEWGSVAPLNPLAKRGGNKPTVDVREVINGIVYILSTGCQWAVMPTDLPPRSAVNRYFLHWQRERTLDRPHHALYIQCRDSLEREHGRQPRSSPARA